MGILAGLPRLERHLDDAADILPLLLHRPFQQEQLRHRDGRCSIYRIMVLWYGHVGRGHALLEPLPRFQARHHGNAFHLLHPNGPGDDHRARTHPLWREE